MVAVVHFAVEGEFPLLAQIEAMVQCNEYWLRHHGDTPGIYESGVIYKREGKPEIWLDIPHIMLQGFDDCEGLSSWRAAELRVAGYQANAVLKRFNRPDGSTLYHCITEVREGDQVYIDDPSARLGMFDREPDDVAGLLPVRYWKACPTGLNAGRPNSKARRPTPGRIETVRLREFEPTRAGWRSDGRPEAPTLRTALVDASPDRPVLRLPRDGEDPLYVTPTRRSP